MGFFDNIPEPKEEDLYMEIQDPLLPDWAYSEEELKKISERDKERGYQTKMIPRPKDSGYFNG